MHRQHTTGARACAHTKEHGQAMALHTGQHTYMYVFIYICICIYMYIYENTHTFTCMCMYVWTQHTTGARACAHTREHGQVTAPPRGSTHICMFQYVYVYVYIYIYMKIHIYLRVYVHRPYTTGARACAHTKKHQQVTALHTEQHTYMYISVYFYVYIYKYTRKYTYIYVHVYICAQTAHYRSESMCTHKGTRARHGPPHVAAHIYVCIYI